MLEPRFEYAARARADFSLDQYAARARADFSRVYSATPHHTRCGPCTRGPFGWLHDHEI